MQDFIRVAYSGDHEQVERPYRVAMGAKAALWGGITLNAGFADCCLAAVHSRPRVRTGSNRGKSRHHSRSEFRDGRSGGVGSGLCQKSRSYFQVRRWGSGTGQFRWGYS